MPRRKATPPASADAGEEQRFTALRVRLMEALLDPNNRLKNVTELCAMLDIDRSTYYRAMDDPAFAGELKRRSIDLARYHLPQVLNTFVREAERGSFQHGKVLLEMAGAYTEKADVTLHTSHEDALKELE